MKLRLKKIEVEGFKVFSRNHSLDFNAPIVVILGPIGTGKTSILEAVEYALYGSLYSIKIRREFRVEDLINDFCDNLAVKLILTDENGVEYEVYRYRDRAGRVKAYLKVNDETIEDEWSKIDSQIEHLLGIGLEGYARQIALRHREIEDIIYGTDMQRSEALDRLLGIETLEKIFRSIPLKRIEDELSKIQNQIEIIDIRLRKEEPLDELVGKLERYKKELFEAEEKIRERERLLSRYRDELKKLKEKEKEYEKIREKEITLKAEIAQLKKRLKALEKEVLEEDLEVLVEKIRSSIMSALKEIMAYKDLEEIEKLELSQIKLDVMLRVFHEKLRKLEIALENMNEEALDINYQLASQRNHYNALKRKLADLEAKMYTLEKEYNTFKFLTEKFGSRAEIRKKIEKLEIELGKIDNLIRLNTCINDLGKHVLSAYIKNGEAECPVCGTKIDDEILKRIKKRLSAPREEAFNRDKILKNLEELKRAYSKLIELEEKIIEMREIENERNNLAKELDEVSANIEELEDLISDIDFKISRINNLIASASSLLLKLARVREIVELRKELEVKKQELNKVLKKAMEVEFDKNYYNTIEEKYYAALSEYNNLSSYLKKLNIDIENLKEKIAYIQELVNKKVRLEKKAVKLSRLRDDLIEIKAAFREIQSSIRRIVVRRIIEKMNDLFQQMYVHPDFSELTIKIRNVKFKREGREYERSMYEILAKRTRDGKWIPALKKMSDGQKRIVILSLLTALFRLSPHNVSFIILDEPTPSIDYECRKAMIKMLAKIEGIDQIIVATQDESFKRIVQDEPAAVIYKLRHEKEGADIEVLR